MRIYVQILKMSIGNRLEYRANFVTSFLFSLVPFGVNTLLWLAVAMQHPEMILGVGGVIRYYFVVLIVSNMTSTSAAVKISEEIRTGALNQHLIKPCNYVLYQLMSDISERLLFFGMNLLPILLLGGLLREYMDFSINPAKVLMFLLLLSAGYLLNFFMDVWIGLYSFYFSRVSSLYTSFRVIRNLSAGLVFPLIFLPDVLLRVLERLPFASVGYIPTLFFIQEIPLSVAGRQLATAWLWILFFLLGSALLWKKGTQRYSAFGG